MVVLHVWLLLVAGKLVHVIVVLVLHAMVLMMLVLVVLLMVMLVLGCCARMATWLGGAGTTTGPITALQAWSRGMARQVGPRLGPAWA